MTPHPDPTTGTRSATLQTMPPAAQTAESHSARVDVGVCRQDYIAQLDAMDPHEACFFCGHAEVVRGIGMDLHLMDEAQLERYVTHCGIQLEAAHKLGMKGEAHRWREAMEAALRERSRRPEVVAAMEQRAGLV